jgi:hypothetical protein
MKKIILFIFAITSQTLLYTTPGAIREIFPIQETWFKNGRFNKIFVIITHKNKETTWYPLSPGQIQKISHSPDDFKKVVISETNQTNINFSGSDLKTYAVFVCNPENKIEKFHFIDKNQKRIAKKYAQDTNNVLLEEEIGEMTLYLL